MGKVNLKSALEKNGATLDENQEKFVSAVESSLSKAFEDMSSNQEKTLGEMLNDAIKSNLGAIEKDSKGNVVTIAEQLKGLAETIESVRTQQTMKLSNKEKFQLRKMIEEKGNDIRDAIRTGKDFEIEFHAAKVAAPFTSATAISNDTGVNLPLDENYTVDGGVVALRFPANFILNVISNSQTAKVPVQRIKTEQATEEGAVAVVAEGGTKPLTSDTFLRTMTARKKYAGRIEWSEEFEMDNNMLFNEVVMMFESKVIRAWQNGIIADIIANGVAYTSSVMDDTLVIPDNGLAVIAAQSVINGMNFNADTVLMHPSDIVTTMFTQDTEGNSRLLPYMQNGQINGMRVVASSTIAIGSAVVMDSTVYREVHSGFILRFGTYSDQFIKNEKSAIGEVFSLLSIAQNELPAVMAIDLDAVKAALLKP